MGPASVQGGLSKRSLLILITPSLRRSHFCGYLFSPIQCHILSEPFHGLS